MKKEKKKKKGENVCDDIVAAVDCHVPAVLSLCKERADCCRSPAGARFATFYRQTKMLQRVVKSCSLRNLAPALGVLVPSFPTYHWRGCQCDFAKRCLATRDEST